MLRVGLTGGLGSGKSTVAAMLRNLGAQVIEADELGRELMEPGRSVFNEIVYHFGPEVVAPDGRLNRAHLAELAFRRGRLQELNAIVHPAVIAAEQDWMETVFSVHPAAVAVVESALIFEVERDARARGEVQGPMADWRRRMDRVVVVTAPDELKIARFVSRLTATNSALDRPKTEADAKNRLTHQISDAQKAAKADYVIENIGDLSKLRVQVEQVWALLNAESNNFRSGVSLE
jgi:dephospho-CoA kinase